MESPVGHPAADPSFMQPGRFDILLGVDMFIEVVLHGWQVGPPGSPIAFETEFCWSLLARLMSTHLLISLQHIMSLSSLEMTSCPNFGRLRKTLRTTWPYSQRSDTLYATSRTITVAQNVGGF